MVRTENKASTKKVYAYRRINAEPEKKPVTPNLSYIYIGKKFRNSLELNEGFETTHFVFAYNEALKLLARLQKANNLPTLVLIDAPTDIAAVRRFLSVISESEAFRTIPVLADVSACRPELVAALSMEKGITDLVQINKNNTLFTKAAFYSRLNKEAEAAKSVNEGFSWDMIRSYGLVRAFDIAFASIAILLLSPLMLLLGTLVKMDGGQTIIEYSNERGLRYQRFRYLRFRTELSYTSKQIADLCHINQLTLDDNNQVTYISKGNQASKVGAFLRATHLDELPALFNVLAGDISLLKSR